MPPGKNRSFSSALKASGLARSKGKREGPSRRGDGNGSEKSEWRGKNNENQKQGGGKNTDRGGCASEQWPRSEFSQLLKKSGDVGAKHGWKPPQHGARGKHNIRKKKNNRKHAKPCPKKTPEGGVLHSGGPGKKRRHADCGGSLEERPRGGSDSVSQNYSPSGSKPVGKGAPISSPTKKRRDGGGATAVRTEESFGPDVDLGVDGAPVRKFTAGSRCSIDGIRLAGINSWLTSRSPVKKGGGNTGAKEVGNLQGKERNWINSTGASTSGVMNFSSLDSNVTLADKKKGQDGGEEKTRGGRKRIIHNGDKADVCATLDAGKATPGDNNRDDEGDSTSRSANRPNQMSAALSDATFCAPVQGNENERRGCAIETETYKKLGSGADLDGSYIIRSEAGDRLNTESVHGGAFAEVCDGPSFPGAAEPQEERAAEKVTHKNSNSAAAAAAVGTDSEEGQIRSNGASRAVTFKDKLSREDDEKSAEEAGIGIPVTGKECKAQRTSKSIDEGLKIALQPEKDDDGKGISSKIIQVLPSLLSGNSPPRIEGDVPGVEMPPTERQEERQTDNNKCAQTLGVDPCEYQLQEEGSTAHKEKRTSLENNLMRTQELPRTVSPIQPVQGLPQKGIANIRECGTTQEAERERDLARNSVLLEERPVLEGSVHINISGLNEVQQGNRRDDGTHPDGVDIDQKSGSPCRGLNKEYTALDKVGEEQEQSLLTPSPKPKCEAQADVRHKIDSSADLVMEAKIAKSVVSKDMNLPQDLPQIETHSLAIEGAGTISDAESGGYREHSRVSLAKVALENEHESETRKSDPERNQTRLDNAGGACGDTKGSFRGDGNFTEISSSSKKKRKQSWCGIAQTVDSEVAVEKKGQGNGEGGEECPPQINSLLLHTADDSESKDCEQSRTLCLPLPCSNHSQVDGRVSDKYHGSDEAPKVAQTKERRRRKEASSSRQQTEDCGLVNMEINISNMDVAPKAPTVERSRCRSAPTRGNISDRVWIDDHRHPSAGNSSMRCGADSDCAGGAEPVLRRSHSDQGHERNKRRCQSGNQDRTTGDTSPPFQSRKEVVYRRGRSGSRDYSSSTIKDQEKKGGCISSPVSRSSSRGNKKRARPCSRSSTVRHQGLGGFSPLIDTRDTRFGSATESNSWQAMSDPEYFILLRLGTNNQVKEARNNERASLPCLSPEAYALLSSLLDAMGMEPFQRESEGSISIPSSSDIGDTVPLAIRPLRDRRPTQTPSSVRDFALAQIAMLTSVPTVPDQKGGTSRGVLNEVASTFSLASHLTVRWYEAKTVRHRSEEKKSKYAEVLRRSLMALLAAMRGLLSRLSDQFDASDVVAGKADSSDDKNMLIRQFFSVPDNTVMHMATNLCPSSSYFSCSEQLFLDVAPLLAELPSRSLGKKHALSVMRNLISLDANTLRKKRAKLSQDHRKTNALGTENQDCIEIVRDSIMERTVRQLLRQENLDERILRSMAKEFGFSRIASSGAAGALGAESQECSVVSPNIDRYRQEQISFLADKREDEEKQQKMQEVMKLEESWDVDANARQGVCVNKMKKSAPAAVEAPLFLSQERECCSTGLLRLDGCIYMSRIALKISGQKPSALSPSTRSLDEGNGVNPSRVGGTSVLQQDKSISLGEDGSTEEASLECQTHKSIQRPVIDMSSSKITPDSLAQRGKEEKMEFIPLKSSVNVVSNSAASVLGSDCRAPPYPQRSNNAENSLPCGSRDTPEMESRLLCKRRRLCLTAYHFFHKLVQNQQGCNMLQGESRVSREAVPSAALACYLLAGKLEDCPVKIKTLLQLARGVQLPPPPLGVLRKWAIDGGPEVPRSRKSSACFNKRVQADKGGANKKEAKWLNELNFGEPRAEWIRHYELRLLALVGFNIPLNTDCWHPTTSIESLINDYESTNAAVIQNSVFLRQKCRQILNESSYTHSALCLLEEPYLVAIATMRLSFISMKKDVDETLGWLDQIAEDDAKPAQILAQHMLNVISCVKLREQVWEETRAMVEFIACRKDGESSHLCNKEENGRVSACKHFTSEEFSEMIPSHWVPAAKIPDNIQEIVRRTNEAIVDAELSVEGCC